MKIGLFGATGNTGLAVIAAASKQGHQVTILVRDPSKLPEDVAAKVDRVVQGDVLDSEDVSKVVDGQDGIIITLGTRTDLGPTTMMSEGTRNILAAMSRHGVKRVAACISAFVYMDMVKVPPIFHAVTEDHSRMWTVIKQSDRDWVAVCPPHIAEDPPRHSYKVAVDSSPGRRISKHDLAEFLLKNLSINDYIHKTVGLAWEE